MFGIEMIDLVPAGAIEDMVRENGGDLMHVLIAAGRKKYDLQTDERFSIQFIETTNSAGEPTLVALPMVLDERLVIKRKLPYYDVIEMMRNAPVAEFVRRGKEAKKALDKLEPILAKHAAALAAGEEVRMRELRGQINTLVATMPPAIVHALGLGSLAVASLGAPAKASPKQLGGPAPEGATASGDNAATEPAEPTDTTANND